MFSISNKFQPFWSNQNHVNFLFHACACSFCSGSWKRSSLRPLFTHFIICTNYNTDIIHQVFLCNWFNINMWVPISIGRLFSEKILLSVRNFPTFVFKITTFHLFKKYYNTHLQSKTFFRLNILSLSVRKIIKKNNLGVTIQVINFLEHHTRSFPSYLSLFGKLARCQLVCFND